MRHHLAREGASVVLAGRNEQALQELAAETQGRHYLADLSDEAQVKQLIASVKADVGPLHGWVLAAGVQPVRPLLMESFATLQQAWAANVYSALGLVGGALKARLVDKGGSIVLFSSAAARAGGAGIVSYAAVKGALEAAARSLALELAGQGIRVNAIAPGVVRTPMSESYMAKLGADQAAKLESSHPLGFGETGDIASAVAYLVSDDSRWMTGSVLQLDGGLTSH